MATGGANYTSEGIDRHSQLTVLLNPACAIILRAIIKYLVKLATPGGAGVALWTLKQFLAHNRQMIECRHSTFLTTYEKLLYPTDGSEPNIDSWDVSLLCKFISKVCQPKPRLQSDVDQIQRFRNKMSHLSNTNISEDDYNMYQYMLYVIMDRLLKILKDDELDRCISELKLNAEVEVPRNPDLAPIFSKLCEDNDETHKKLDTLSAECRDMHAILRRLDQSRNLETDVFMTLSTCSPEQQNSVSKTIVGLFEENVGRDSQLNSDLSQEKMHVLKNIIEHIMKNLCSNGSTVLAARQKCIAIRMRFQTIGAMCDLFEQSADGTLTEMFRPIETFFRTLPGYETLEIEVNVIQRDYFRCIQQSVRRLVESEDDTRANLPVVRGVTVEQCDDESEDLRIRINLHPKTRDHLQHIQDACSSGQLDEQLAKIAAILNSAYGSNMTIRSQQGEVSICEREKEFDTTGEQEVFQAAVQLQSTEQIAADGLVQTATDVKESKGEPEEPNDTLQEEAEKEDENTDAIPLHHVKKKTQKIQEVPSRADADLVEPKEPEDRQDAQNMQSRKLPMESGPACYQCTTVDLALKMPFSKYIFECIEATREEFVETLTLLKGQFELEYEDDLPEPAFEELLLKHEYFILKKFPDMTAYTYEHWEDDYISDFCNILSFGTCPSLQKDKRIEYMKWAISQNTDLSPNDPSRLLLNLHTTFWSHTELFNSELQLLEICREVIFDENDELLDILTNVKHETQFDFAEIENATIDLEKSCVTNTAETDVHAASSVVLSGTDDVCAGNFTVIDTKPVAANPADHCSSHDALVDMICKRMLPTRGTIEKHKGIQKWQRKVNCVITLAARVSSDTTVLHYLRFCNDLASELFLSYSINDVHLQTIGQLLRDGSTLDDVNIFETMKQIVTTAPNDARSDCQNVFVTYFMRCLISDPESPALCYLLQMVINGELPDRVSYMKSPIQLVLQYEQDEETGGFLNLITEETTIIQCPCFSLIDCFLQTIATRNQVDNPCVLLFIDMLEDTYLDIMNAFDEAQRAGELEDTATTMEETFMRSHYILMNNNFGIDVVAALAFFKSYVRYAIEANTVRPEYFSAVFSCKDNPLNDVLIQYVFKVIAIGKCHGHSIKACNKFELCMPRVTPVDWDIKYGEICFDMCPTALHSPSQVGEFVTLVNATLDEIEVEKRLIKLVKKALIENDANCMMVLFTFAMNKVYLPRCFHVIDDTMNALAKRVVRMASDNDTDEKKTKVLKCLLGQENIHIQHLMLDETSSPAETIIASFLQTLFTVLLSYTPDHKAKHTPLLMKCLTQATVKTLFLPGFPDSTPCSTGLKSTRLPMCSFFMCSCGHRIATKTDGDSTTGCIICGKLLNSDSLADLDDKVDVEIRPGYVVCEEMTTPNFAVRDMSPAMCNVVYILVKGCLLGSVAFGFATPQFVEEEMCVPTSNAMKTVWEDLQAHWRNLEQLLNIDMHSVGLLLHTIVCHIRDFLTQDCSPMIIPGERLDWERRFALNVTPIINNRFQLMGQLVRKHDKLLDIPQNIMEQHLHEFNDQTKLVEMNLERSLPFLLRLKGAPTKENFLFELRECQKSFPFLLLTVEHEHDLQLPIHILSIVRWHIAATANANYLMKKQECMKMSVSNFIYQSLNMEKRHLLKRRFEAFQRSWAELKDHVSIKSLDIERIHPQTNVAECLILNDDSKVYTVLRLLVAKQNSFLDKTIELAHACPAVRFFRREDDVAVIPTVQICEVKPSHLIDFTWNNRYFQFSQCDQEYGHGRKVFYDFQTIERSLAFDIVEGKSYICLNNALPTITFMDELYRNYTLLVKELNISVKQSSLPYEISAAVRAMRALDPNMTTELLTHLGIIMTLLNKTSGDPNKPLIDFVDEWKHVLTHNLPRDLLPRTDTAVRLTHVVALHELLEELNSDTVIVALDEEFRMKLDMDTEYHFNRLVEKRHLSAVVLKTFKIFVHRCMSLEDAASDQPLLQYLSDESFWPDGVKVQDGIRTGNDVTPLENVIPRGMLVGHVYSTVALIEDELKKQKVKLTNIATSRQSQSRSTVGSTTARMKRSAKNLGDY